MVYGSDITETLGSVGGRTSAQGFYSSDEVRKQYTGYERDDESGLDYAQAKYYNSNHGRFTSVDPLTASASIKNPQTFNRYSYVLNSPYKFTDPLGLISEYACGACGNRCHNSDGSSGPTPLDDNSWKVWRLPERVEATPPAPPPVISVQMNGASYIGVLENSTFSDDDPSGSVRVTLNYVWQTESTSAEGHVTRAFVSEEVKNILNDSLSRMASNILNAYKSVYNIALVSKTSLTLEGKGSLGTKYNKTVMTGREFEGSVTFEFNDPKAVYDETREVNDTIQLQMVVDIGEKSMITAWSGGKSVNVGEQVVTAGVTLSSQFSQLARDEANNYAKAKYNETFPSRFQRKPDL